MNNLLQIMPMPIIMRGGGHFNLTPCASVTMIISGFFFFLALISIALGLMLDSFGREVEGQLCFRIVTILLFLCILSMGIALLFNLIGC